MDWILDINSQAKLLIGDNKSGKTHLSHVWASKFQNAKIFTSDEFCYSSIDKMYSHKMQACVLDGIHEIFIKNTLYAREFEEKLFHFYNYLISNQIQILFTSNTEFYDLDIQIIDLKSRLYSLCIMNIPKPSDETIKAIIKKLFKDIGIIAQNDMIEYIFNRSNRSSEDIYNIVHFINQESIKENIAISMHFLRTLFKEHTNIFL